MAKKKTAPAKQEDRLEVVKTSQIKKGDKVSAAHAFYTAVDDAYQDDASVWCVELEQYGLLKFMSYDQYTVVKR